MLFTTLPIGYTEGVEFPRIEIGGSVQPVWLSREHAEFDAVDSALEVWGVTASWETDTFKLNREEYPMSKARGLRVSSPLVKLKEGLSP